MSKLCTYLNSMAFKSFKMEFNLSRCRLRLAGVFSQILIKLSIERIKISLEICGGGLMLSNSIVLLFCVNHNRLLIFFLTSLKIPC